MIKILRRFRRNADGVSYEGLAVGAAAIAVVCVLGAHVLDRLSRSGGLPTIAIISSDGSAISFGGRLAALHRRTPGASRGRFDGIDYTETGSLREKLSRPVVLDPCAQRPKE